MAYTRERFAVLPSDGSDPPRTRAALQRVQRGIPHPVYTVDIRDFGVDTRPNDYATEINLALGQLTPGDKILIPFATYFGSTLKANARDIGFVGYGFEQHGLWYTGGAGNCVQIGTDDGLDPGLGLYNGQQGFSYTGLFLRTHTPATPLNNAKANYTPGTYAFRDYRGGFLHLDHFVIRGFDYAFAGNNSDVNPWSNGIIWENHNGCWLGPRSDQFTAHHIWTSSNDIAFQVEGAQDITFSRVFSDSDGSSTTNPFQIRSYASTARDSSGIIFDHCWFENTITSAQDVEAFVDVGIADANRNGLVKFVNPKIVVNNATTAGVQHTFHLWKADNTRAVVVDSPFGANGSPTTNLKSVGKVVNAGASTTVPYVRVTDDEGRLVRIIENYSATQVRCLVETPDKTLPNANVLGGTGPVNLIVDDRRNPTFESLTVGTNSAGGQTVLNGPAADANRTISWRTANLNRWKFGMDSIAESGANAGGGFFFSRYDDSGTFIDQVLAWARNSGIATFFKGLNVGSSGAGAILNLNGPAGDANRRLAVLTAGGTRWAFGGDNTAESGSNVGTDAFLNAYDDTGTVLGTVLRAKRATQTAKINTARTVSSKSANYTTVASDSGTAFRLSASGGAVTLTVLSTAETGWWADVLKSDATANSITVSGTTCTFNGAASLTTSTQYKGWRIIHAGSGTYEVYGTY